MDAKPPARMPVEIAAFEPTNHVGAIDVILPVQHEEIAILITLEDQSDLNSIHSSHRSCHGGFLAAKIDGKIVGSLGPKDTRGAKGTPRKRFVAILYPGSGFSMAARWTEILLYTMNRSAAVRRFYKKSSITQIAKGSLLRSFPPDGSGSSVPRNPPVRVKRYSSFSQGSFVSVASRCRGEGSAYV